MTSSWIDPILTEVGKHLIEVGIELPMQVVIVCQDALLVGR